MDSTGSKRLDQRHPEVVFVARDKIDISGDNGAEKVSEPDVHWRAIVESSYANVEKSFCCFCRGVRKTTCQIMIQVARGYSGSARSGYANEVPRASHVDGKERVEHRCHEYRTASVRLGEFRKIVRVRRCAQG